MGTKQVETLTVVGDVTESGNAEVVITSAYLATSPYSVSVAVLITDDAATVAGKVRDTLAYNTTVNALFAVSGTGADVILTMHEERANDSSLNIAIDNDTCEGLTTVATSTSTTPGVGISNGYASLADFQARFNSQNPADDTTQDDVVEAIIESASRQIDNYCGRRFYSTGTDETKYFTAYEPHVIFTDDIISVTSLKTDDDGDGVYENTWAATDYREMPNNVLPKTWLAITSSGANRFPRYADGLIEIVGRFGYCVLADVPSQIKEACLILANRIYMRGKVPFGMTGNPDIGLMTKIPKLDPDVEAMLEPFRRLA